MITIILTLILKFSLQIMLADDFPVFGITLKGIQAFIEVNGGTEAFSSLRTTDICEQFMKPATFEAQESFCMSLKDEESFYQTIAPATAFVSHAWGHEFLDVVAALEEYDSRQTSPTVFWFDIFSNNQHKTAVRDFSWWQTVFKDNIGNLKKTLLVLEWDDPKPLTRAWCLWEMVSTVNTGSHFQVLMSPKNHGSFSNALVNQFDTLVYKTCNVDLANAQAFSASDRESILKAVEATAGFAKVNQQVIGIMREWMARSGQEALQRLPEQDRALSTLQNNLAVLLQDQGRLQEAEAFFRVSLSAQRKKLGNGHQTTLGGINNLASCLKLQGKLVAAEVLFREALDGRKRIFGTQHLLTLSSTNNLAALLQERGSLREAKSLFKQVLLGRRRALGDLDQYTLNSVSNLGSVYKLQKKLAKAEPLLVEALQGRRATLGNMHPDTLGSIHNLGALYQDQGRLKEAEELYREVLELRRQTLGELHPQTKTSVQILEDITKGRKGKGQKEKAPPLEEPFWDDNESQMYIASQMDVMDVASQMDVAPRMVFATNVYTGPRSTSQPPTQPPTRPPVRPQMHVAPQMAFAPQMHIASQMHIAPQMSVAPPMHVATQMASHPSGK